MPGGKNEALIKAVWIQACSLVHDYFNIRYANDMV